MNEFIYEVKINKRFTFFINRWEIKKRQGYNYSFMNFNLPDFFNSIDNNT